ncbi:unnamed protein product [Rotaria sordida]|uniref:Uncharacterized protein n=1 Tax=Rotaria sordida TaxID=392033 RepID=A0A814T437_9BILA|nr:unnamed protein product [Rotaria sordida]CAF1147948.1 unnamed protein product [Rotaria sordida]CAF1156747.1 unnamed protein product [Rotaria sordida]CAF4083495.1 unnamed protein product [Rotaria sordida]
MSDYPISSHFIYTIAKFLVILSHDTLNSKQLKNFEQCLSEYFKLLSLFYIRLLLLQKTHILNILDYTHKKHDGHQYKHYHNELYVEYLTSIIT